MQYIVIHRNASHVAAIAFSMADQANRSRSSEAQNNLVSQLCRLAESLGEQNNSTQRRAESSDNQTETVAAAISRLFLSVSNSSSSSNINSTDSPAAESTFQASNVNNVLSSRPPQFEPRHVAPKQSYRKKPYAKGNLRKKALGQLLLSKM